VITTGSDGKIPVKCGQLVALRTQLL